MSIADGFNIWIGKFIWDCLETVVIVFGVVAFWIVKEYVGYRKGLKEEEKHSETKR